MKKSRILFKVNCSIPADIPSLMLPRIASGPITKRSEALTKPSTKGDLPSLSKRCFNRIPTTSKRSSILSKDPSNPPRRSEASTTRSGKPSGSWKINSLSQSALMAPAAAINVIAPRTSITRLRVFSLILFPIRTPKLAPATIAKIFIRVPIPTNM